MNLVRPYQKVTLLFLANELSLSIPQIEHLLMDLIITEQIYGTIDQPQGYLLLSHQNHPAVSSAPGMGSGGNNGENSYITPNIQMIQDIYWLNTYNHFVQQFPEY